MRLALILIAAALVGGGCVSTLTRPAPPASLPITLGAAPTNATEAVAWVMLAQQLNRTVNPTPTQPLVEVTLGAVIAVLTAAGGWMARHQTTRRTDVPRTGDTPGSRG
jgi:hypothetical protein